MIELFSSDTPNGKKISILLEEIGCNYKVTKMDLSKDDQFKSEGVKIIYFPYTRGTSSTKINRILNTFR